MTVQEHLDSLGLGLTVQMAKTFIMSNLNNLEVIYNACLQYGINNDMIGEILDIDGIDGEFVSSFFDLNGFNGSALGFNNEGNDISVESGFTEEWLNGKILYSVIIDAEDDDNDGDTTDYMIIGNLFDQNTVMLDFSADGTYEVTGESYSVIDGVLRVYDQDGDYEYSTLTSVGSNLITTTVTNSWDDSSETVIDFLSLPDAQNYLDSLIA